jgi:hypothetical protein
LACGKGREDVQQRRIDKTMTNSERKRRRTTKRDRQDNDTVKGREDVQQRRIDKTMTNSENLQMRCGITIPLHESPSINTPNNF